VSGLPGRAGKFNARVITVKAERRVMHHKVGAGPASRILVTLVTDESGPATGMRGMAKSKRCAAGGAIPHVSYVTEKMGR
jgi:hypothetical protein